MRRIVTIEIVLAYDDDACGHPMEWDWSNMIELDDPRDLFGVQVTADFPAGTPMHERFKRQP